MSDVYNNRAEALFRELFHIPNNQILTRPLVLTSSGDLDNLGDFLDRNGLEDLAFSLGLRSSRTGGLTPSAKSKSSRKTSLVSSLRPRSSLSDDAIKCVQTIFESANGVLPEDVITAIRYTMVINSSRSYLVEIKINYPGGKRITRDDFAKRCDELIIPRLETSEYQLRYRQKYAWEFFIKLQPEIDQSLFVAASAQDHAIFVGIPTCRGASKSGLVYFAEELDELKKDNRVLSRSGLIEVFDELVKYERKLEEFSRGDELLTDWLWRRRGVAPISEIEKRLHGIRRDLDTVCTSRSVRYQAEQAERDALARITSAITKSNNW